MAETENLLVAPPELPQVPAPRLAWVDLIRAGGAFLVVLAHIVLYPSLKGSGPLWAQTLYYASTRLAVPLFFMASGFLLLAKQEPLGVFFRKRALRVFIPFLIWSFVYLAWNGGFNDANLSVSTIGSALERIVRGPRAAHLWFFYVLIGLYLITPSLRILAEHARDTDLLYFCGMWFLLDPVLSLVQYLTSLKIGFEFQFFTGYIGYFVMGHYLGRLPLTRPRVWFALAILFASFLFLFVAIYVGEQQPKYDQFFEGYLSVPVVLMTASAFYVIRSVNALVSPQVLKWILPLSGASLGIYLLHVIVLDASQQYVADALPFLQSGSTILVMPAVALAGYLVCFLIVWLLQKIPILKYSVP